MPLSFDPRLGFRGNRSLPMVPPSRNSAESWRYTPWLQLIGGGLALVTLVAIATALIRGRFELPPADQAASSVAAQNAAMPTAAAPTTSTNQAAETKATPEQRADTSSAAPAINSPAAASDQLLPDGELVADLKQDFQAGTNGHPDHAGSGQWWYLASMLANPWFSRHELFPMAWDGS